MTSKSENEIEDLEKENSTLREALKQVLYQNEMLLNWVNGSVVTVDKEGIIVSANNVALDSYSCSSEELIGLHHHATCHHTLDDGGEYPWEFCPVFAAIEDGSSHHVTGDLFWKTDGSSFVVDYIVSPVRDENNLISGATLIFRNLTDQRLREAKRIHGLKLESIGELSAGIAHEINTPIQFIGSNLAFFEEVSEDLFSLLSLYQNLKNTLSENGEFKEQLKTIEEKEEEIDLEYLRDETPIAIEQTDQGVKRVSELVLGLKGFAHSADIENKSSIDLNEIINNSLIVCKSSYRDVAELKLELGDLPVVRLNPGDIGQVILNLLVNAVHAIEEVRGDSNQMGCITVVSKQEGNDAVVEVSDTGGGIPDSVKDRIFDPFFTTKEVGQGSGQGLAISRTIVHDRHGGELTCITNEGEGTTFRVRLPLAG